MKSVKVQQHIELSQRVHELKLALVSLRQQASSSQNLFKEPKICLPGKFDGTRSQFRGFLNQVRLVIHIIQVDIQPMLVELV